jgi:hypothetical protein
MAKPISSLSDADTRLAELNTLILELERERSALLAAELANAETRVSEIESFIGVYVASSPVGGAKASTTRKSAEKKATNKRRGRPPVAGKTKATSKRRGRPPGSGKKKAATTKPAAKPTTKGAVKKKRTRGNKAERIGSVKAHVKKAGKEGVSARRVAKELGFPYVSVLSILNEASDFKKVGEKRDRRYFLK